jgi:leucyl aminopeptidase (aminopeptidase T)
VETSWQAIAQRCVYGLQVQPGELVQVRALVDRLDVIQEMLLAVELAGATPLLELVPPAYLEKLVAEADPAYLEKWDNYRLGFMGQYDRILVLQGEPANFASLPVQGLNLWRKAQDRLGELEETRRLPFLLVAVPTATLAGQLSLSLENLDEIIKPALAVSPAELREQIRRVLAIAENGREMTVTSGDGHELHLKLADDRPWLNDDGLIDEPDRARGAIVSNLPAGSVYTTVLEEATQGSIRLPKCRGIEDVVLQFEKGRVIEVSTKYREDAEAINKWLDSFSGEPRRVSHIGIGLNPYLHEFLDWTLVDEHLQGYLFLALGENRYMGGQNESALNVDFTIPGVTLAVDGRTIVEAGKIAG